MTINANVVVQRILYRDEGKTQDWTVMLTDIGKCAGRIRWQPDCGEMLTLTGEWKAYRGEKNFNFSGATPNVPTNERDTLRYACSRTSGIGEATEDAIWEAYGDAWREVGPNEIKGLTQKRLDGLRETINAIDTEIEKSQAIGWLMGLGASDNLASLAWEEFGKGTIWLVKKNCYILADLPRHSFSHIDGRIRTELGVKDDDRRRISAAVLYSLRRLTNDGSTVIRWPIVAADCAQLVGCECAQLIDSEAQRMIDIGRLAYFATDELVALESDYNNESDILRWVNDF